MGDVVDCYDSADTAFYLVHTQVKFVQPSKTMYVCTSCISLMELWLVWFQNVLFNVAQVLVIDA